MTLAFILPATSLALLAVLLLPTQAVRLDFLLKLVFLVECNSVTRTIPIQHTIFRTQLWAPLECAWEFPVVCYALLGLVAVLVPVLLMHVDY